MIYIKSFLFVGLVSLIGQIILDNTKLTPGHITSLFVVIGAILSFLGVYDLFVDFASIGASIPITSFGNMLYKASLEGFNNNGIIGLFSNMLSTTSLGICSTVIFAFVISIILSPKD